MKRFFLGMAAGYSGMKWLKHLTTVGHQEDYKNLTKYLATKYNGKAVLTKNGRSALTLALKAFFKPGDAILINGFTCYAVCEAVKAANLIPIFADISKTDLNFNVDTLEDSIKSTNNNRIRGLIIQNTLGNPVNISEVEKFAKDHELIIIEDLAHCTGIKYADGREVGTVGAAVALSFGKDKSIDTISGGALVLRYPTLYGIIAPMKVPKISDHLRAKFYPMFGTLCRRLTRFHIGGALMRFLVKIHFVERSADNRLDLERKPSKFEARLAMEQLQELKKDNKPLREFCYVNNRSTLLEKLQRIGYYFSGFWYEKPISPERYYSLAGFPENRCPNALYAASHIINIPTYYSKNDLKPAMDLIEKYKEKGNNEL